MSEFIAEAQVLIRPNTAAFAAALKAQVEAAVASVGPVAVPIAAVPVARGAGAALAAETRVASTAIKEETVALDVLGATAVKTATQREILNREERKAALAHSQAARGVAAESASLLGLRGATLAASFPFLAATVATIAFTKALKGASDQTEELNKVAVVFGDSAKEVEDFAKTSAAALGISDTEALRAAGIFGNLFRAIKIGRPEAAAMSVELVKLAADLASFNNADPSRTLEALRAGLVGQARPLRVFGAFLTAARVQQEALLETGKKNVKDITEANKVQARYNLILADTVLAQGDVERTQDRLANQSRILSANISDIADTIGSAFLPVVLLAVQDVNLLAEALKKLAALKIHIPGTEGGSQSGLGLLQSKIQDIFGKTGARNLELSVLFPGVGLTINNLELLNKGLKALLGTEDDAAKHTGGFVAALDNLDAGARALRISLEGAVQAAKDFSAAAQTATGLEFQQLNIQTGLAPGGRAAEEANLRQQIEEDKKIVALTKSGTKARRDALEELKKDQDDLAALEDQDAADAKDRAARIKRAAAERKRAAREAAQAQEDATRAFIESFAQRAQALQNRLTTAELFGNANQQIAANKAIIKADAAEIKAIQQRIRHLHLHGDALKAARAEIARLLQEIFNTQNAILQLQAERKQAIIDARQSHLEAQLAIAETTKSTRDDIAAEKALIKFDQAQIRRILAIKRRRRLTQDEAAQLDAYRVDLAQRNKALRDLQKEQEKGNQTAQAFFKFLQTQAGFAANLLGNLIPGGLTGGLVGGTTGGAAGAAAPIVRPGDLPREQASGIGFPVQSAAAAASAANRGVRPVQVDTTNALLRQIVNLLRQQTGRMGHPEARYQKATSNAVLDTEHGHG